MALRAVRAENLDPPLETHVAALRAVCDVFDRDPAAVRAPAQVGDRPVRQGTDDPGQGAARHIEPDKSPWWRDADRPPVRRPIDRSGPLALARARPADVVAGRDDRPRAGRRIDEFEIAVDDDSEPTAVTRPRGVLNPVRNLRHARGDHTARRRVDPP